VNSFYKRNNAELTQWVLKINHYSEISQVGKSLFQRQQKNVAFLLLVFSVFYGLTSPEEPLGVLGDQPVELILETHIFSHISVIFASITILKVSYEKQKEERKEYGEAFSVLHYHWEMQKDGIKEERIFAGAIVSMELNNNCYRRK
jgi:hypothetical protein